MRALVVLSFELPDDGAAFLSDILDKVDPPGLPFFAGQVRITVGEVATRIEDWLDEE